VKGKYSILKSANKGKVLISGMGGSFGLLYSAILHIQPDTAVIVTSSKFRNNVAEVCEKAGFDDKSRVHVLTMNDVFAGFNETPELLQKIWPIVEYAEKIIINLTGGTTRKLQKNICRLNVSHLLIDDLRSSSNRTHGNLVNL
jgi:hypothetical protein